MPRFACPQCKKTLSATEEERGSIISCEHCGKKLRVPATKPATAAASSPKADAARSDRPTPSSIDDDEAPPRRSPARADADEEHAPARKPGVRRITAADEDEDDKPRRKKKKRRRQRKTSAVVGVLSGIGGLLFIAIIILILTGKWVDLFWDPLQRWLENIGVHPLIAIGVTAVVLCIPLGFFVMLATKSAFLDGIPEDLDFVSADPDEFEKLDRKRLKNYTEALEAQGFKRLMDYKVQTEMEHFPTGFARLMVNSKDHTFAEINQGFFPDGKPVPMRCSINTFLDGGWSLCTTDRRASKETYAMRRPMSVWQSRADDKPAELLAAHKKLKTRMLRDLETEVLTDDTADAYFEHERKANRDRQRAIQKRWALGLMLEVFFYEYNPRTEWMGAYKKGSRKKKEADEE